MDGGLLGSIIGATVVILGGGTKVEMGRVARRDKKIEVLEATLAARDATIASQERQIDRLQITAEIQDKLFTQLQQPPRRQS